MEGSIQPERLSHSQVDSSVMEESAPAFLCPACQRPLNIPDSGVVTVACEYCRAEIDVARLETLVGKPRFLPERCFSGETVGGFQVLARLGAGGMGSVYQARGPSGEMAALKFLSGSLAADPEVLARFEREIAVQRRLDHPCIVRILDQGNADKIPWFAMELVEGPTLGEFLTQTSPTLEQVRALFDRLLTGLSHAHRAGVVHRDLKPSNVLIGPEGAVLADFGIAHLEDGVGLGRTQLTRTSTVLGTFSYMSPEQRRGKRVDARSDLFAVGVLLYEVLTGERPEGAFRPISALRSDVDRTLDGLVAELLAPDPADRPASAEEVRQRLRRSLRPRRHQRAIAVAAATVLVGAGVMAWVVFPRPSGSLGQRAVVSGRGEGARVVVPEPPTAAAVQEFTEQAPALLPPPLDLVQTVDTTASAAPILSITPLVRTVPTKAVRAKSGPVKPKVDSVFEGSLGGGEQNQIAVKVASPSPVAGPRNQDHRDVKGK